MARPVSRVSVALQVDNRMRAWYLGNMAMGLLYTCSLGDIQADAPVALVQNRRQNGADVMEVVPMDHQLPGQREQAYSFQLLTFASCVPSQHAFTPICLQGEFAHRRTRKPSEKAGSRRNVNGGRIGWPDHEYSGHCWATTATAMEAVLCSCHL